MCAAPFRYLRMPAYDAAPKMCYNALQMTEEKTETD
jgi:hypothetical protein